MEGDPNGCHKIVYQCLCHSHMTQTLIHNVTTILSLDKRHKSLNQLDE